MRKLCVMYGDRLASVRPVIAGVLRPINRLANPNAYIMAAAIKVGLNMQIAELWRLGR